METTFNTDIEKQFIPYWNGMLHLVGKVEDRILIKRYDWHNILKECKKFEKTYMNTSNYCESCPFGFLPGHLEERVRGQGWDCKKIAQDNDAVYIYCVEKRRRMILLWSGIALAVVIVILIASYLVFFKKPATSLVIVN